MFCAISQYLIQCWYTSTAPNGVSSPRWVSIFSHNSTPSKQNKVRVHCWILFIVLFLIMSSWYGNALRFTWHFLRGIQCSPMLYPNKGIVILSFDLFVVNLNKRLKYKLDAWDLRWYGTLWYRSDISSILCTYFGVKSHLNSKLTVPPHLIYRLVSNIRRT